LFSRLFSLFPAAPSNKSQIKQHNNNIIFYHHRPTI
jgi:hypothetical protein